MLEKLFTWISGKTSVLYFLARIRNCCRSENVLLFLATWHEPLNPVFILLPIYSCDFEIELSGGLDSGLHCFRCGGTFLCQLDFSCFFSLERIREALNNFR
jgi:hypothetical protein